MMSDGSTDSTRLNEEFEVVKSAGSIIHDMKARLRTQREY